MHGVSDAARGLTNGEFVNRRMTMVGFDPIPAAQWGRHGTLTGDAIRCPEQSFMPKYNARETAPFLRLQARGKLNSVQFDCFA